MPDTQNIEGLGVWSEYMVNTGLYWCGAAPWSNVSSDMPAEEQLSGFAHSFLVALSGSAAAVDPYKLAPKNDVSNDLGGEHLNELLYHDISSLSPAAQKLIEDLRSRYRTDAVLPWDRVTVMGYFIAGICQIVAAGYELRHLTCDGETGDVLGEGPDIAPHLPAVFAWMWAVHPIVAERYSDNRPNRETAENQ